MKKNKSILTLAQQAISTNLELKQALDNVCIFVNESAVVVAGSVKSDTVKRSLKAIISSLPEVTLVIDDLRVEPQGPQRISIHLDWANENILLV